MKLNLSDKDIFGAIKGTDVKLTLDVKKDTFFFTSCVSCSSSSSLWVFNYWKMAKNFSQITHSPKNLRTTFPKCSLPDYSV